jgi:polyketide cyclase/dehydrase/lipid transport protein
MWLTVSPACRVGRRDVPEPPAIGAHLQASQSACSVPGDLTQPESDQDKVGPMTIRTESRITIASSVPDVWAYVCDVGRWPEWAPTVLEGRVRGGAPLQPGSRVDQRAKLMLGLSRGRSQEVTDVEAPRFVAFAGPMGMSAARWAMELAPADDGQTDAKMWIEVDLAGIMRAIPGILKGRIQRVSDREMVAIKAAVESAAREGAES